MTPQEAAAAVEQEDSNVKGWKRSVEALETSTFHGRFAPEIATLVHMCRTEHEKAQRRLVAAQEQVSKPMGDWNKQAAGAAIPKAQFEPFDPAVKKPAEVAH